MILVVDTQTVDYSIVIMGAVFVFATAWWMFSAKKWFHGPIINVDGLSVGEKDDTPGESVEGQISSS